MEELQRRWTDTPVDETAAGRLQGELGCSRLLARLLTQRGFQEAASAGAFLQPRLKNLRDPFELPGLQAAAERLRTALARNEKVLLFGDYDVDGLTSTVLLVGILRTYGLSPAFAVPRRLEEGYGLSREALERALSEHGRPDLLLAVDCGTNSTEVVTWMRAQGTDVLIVDHHQLTGERPDALLVNPHTASEEDAAPFRELCSAGLCFKLVHGLLKLLRASGDALAYEISLKDHLDLVALGTIADLVPLRGENRIFAHAGLRVLEKTPRAGLGALMEVSGLQQGVPLACSDVGFRLGPRINACGRLSDAALPLRLLLSEDLATAREVARELDNQNSERQQIERAITAEAEERIGRGEAGTLGFVLHGADWHPGVVGVVAGRLAQRFHRPCLVLGGNDGLAHGSGRGIVGVDLIAALEACASQLVHWGGHPAAVGLSMEPARVPELRERFNEALREQLCDGLPAPCLAIDDWVSPAELGPELLDDLDQLHPFGFGNREPVLGVRAASPRAGAQHFGQGHIRFHLPTQPGNLLSAVGWGMGKNPPPAGEPLELAVRLRWNRWNGRCQPQAEVLDWRRA